VSRRTNGRNVFVRKKDKKIFFGRKMDRQTKYIFCGKRIYRQNIFYKQKERQTKDICWQEGQTFIIIFVERRRDREKNFFWKRVKYLLWVERQTKIILNGNERQTGSLGWEEGETTMYLWWEEIDICNIAD